MRFASLFALALVLPVVAYAATININTANTAQLDTLPGIGPSKAAAIVDYRTKHGPFAVIEDIQNVSGIGPVTFANMKGLITVGTTPQEVAPSPIAPAPTQPKPSPQTTSYKKVQAVEPITSTNTNIQIHEDGVVAPTAAVEPAAVGATLPPAPNARAQGIFHSPWIYGLVGVIIVAGGAFILL